MTSAVSKTLQEVSIIRGKGAEAITGEWLGDQDSKAASGESFPPFNKCLMSVNMRAPRP